MLILQFYFIIVHLVIALVNKELLNYNQGFYQSK